MIKKILMMVVLLTLTILGYKILQPKKPISEPTTDIATNISTQPTSDSTDSDDIPFDNIPPTYVDLGPADLGPAPTSELTTTPVLSTQSVASRFSCDGRTHCSQMTSCAEATYFTNHCPNTKMDGNHDGVPCEQQWCN